MNLKNFITSCFIILFIIFTANQVFSNDLSGSWSAEFDNTLNGSLDEKFITNKLELKKNKNGYFYENEKIKYSIKIFPKKKYHNLLLHIQNSDSGYNLISTLILSNNKYAKGSWHDNVGKSGDIILSKIINKKQETNFKKTYKGIGLQGKYGSYQWTTAYKIPGNTGAYVIFLANAKNDIYLSFSKNKKQNSKMYEIVIGSWNNTRSVIRYKSQGMEIASTNKNKNPASLIERDKWQWYWAGVIDGKISVGKGNTINENIIMETKYDDKDLNNNLNWLCFSSWDTSVSYKNITIMR